MVERSVVGLMVGKIGGGLAEGRGLTGLAECGKSAVRQVREDWEAAEERMDDEWMFHGDGRRLL